MDLRKRRRSHPREATATRQRCRRAARRAPGHLPRTDDRGNEEPVKAARTRRNPAHLMPHDHPNLRPKRLLYAAKSSVGPRLPTQPVNNGDAPLPIGAGDEAGLAEDRVSIA